MSQLLLLAKTKNSKGMLPLCTEMMNKTRSLLTMWEPSLVEEAFEFIERHRIIDDPENNVMVSPVGFSCLFWFVIANPSHTGLVVI